MVRGSVCDCPRELRSHRKNLLRLDMKPADEILCSIVMTIDGVGLNCRQGHALSVVGEEILEHGVHYTPSRWMGRPLSDAEAKAWRRALGKLEDAGFVERITSGARTLHVTPTPKGLAAGVAALRRHCGRKYPDVDAVLHALRNAEWATEAHREAVRRGK